MLAQQIDQLLSAVVEGDAEGGLAVPIPGLDPLRVLGEQGPHPPGVPEGGGGEQVDPGAPLHEQLHLLLAPVVDGSRQGGAAVGVEGLQVGASLEEQLHEHGGRAVAGCQVQGCPPPAVDGLHPGPAVEQEPGDLLVVGVDGLMEGGGAHVRLVAEGDRLVHETGVLVEIGHEALRVAQQDEVPQVVAASPPDQGLEGGDEGRPVALVRPLAGGGVDGGSPGRVDAVGVGAVGEVELHQAGVGEEPGVAEGGLAAAPGLAAEGVDVGAVLDQQPRDLVLGVGGVGIDADDAVQEGAAPGVGVG